MHSITPTSLLWLIINFAFKMNFISYMNFCLPLLQLTKKIFLLCLHSLGKTEGNVRAGIEPDQLSEYRRRSRGFSPAHEFSTFAKFTPGYRGKEIMFYFFYKIIIFKEKTIHKVPICSLISFIKL